MRVKIAVLAPMPNASESTATSRKTGDLRSVRREYRKSRRIAVINRYTAVLKKGYEMTSVAQARRKGGLRVWTGAFKEPGTKDVFPVDIADENTGRSVAGSGH